MHKWCIGMGITIPPGKENSVSEFNLQKIIVWTLMKKQLFKITRLRSKAKNLSLK